MPQLSKREVVIDTAIVLFKKYGINSTGVESIIKEANVSKKTLYNHFKTKDDLILASLRKDDEIGRNSLMRYAEQASDDPKFQILAIFDFYNLWFNSVNFNGCLFTNSAGEIAEENAAGKRICAEHKRLIQQYIENLAIEASIDNPKDIALKLNLLLEGSIVYAYVMENKSAALEAKKIAALILNTEI